MEFVDSLGSEFFRWYATCFLPLSFLLTSSDGALCFDLNNSPVARMSGRCASLSV